MNKKSTIRVVRAFTLVEMLISLSVVMVFLGLSVPRFINKDERFLLDELDTLFMTFSYLQQKAQTDHKKIMLVFEHDRNRYYFTDDHEKKRWHALNQVVSFGYLKSARGAPAKHKKLIKQAITFPAGGHKRKNYVTFFPNGKISPGSIYLIDKKQKHMVALTCSIMSVASIRKYIYRHKKWICR